MHNDNDNDDDNHNASILKLEKKLNNAEHILLVHAYTDWCIHTYYSLMFQLLKER